MVLRNKLIDSIYTRFPGGDEPFAPSNLAAAVPADPDEASSQRYNHGGSDELVLIHTRTKTTKLRSVLAPSVPSPSISTWSGTESFMCRAATPQSPYIGSRLSYHTQTMTVDSVVAELCYLHIVCSYTCQWQYPASIWALHVAMTHRRTHGDHLL